MTLTSWFTHNSLRRPRFVLVTHGTVQSPSRHKLSTLKIFSRVVNTVQWLATMTHDSSTGRLENNHTEYTTTEPFKRPAKWRHQQLCIRLVSLNYHNCTFLTIVYLAELARTFQVGTITYLSVRNLLQAADFTPEPNIRRNQIYSCDKRKILLMTATCLFCLNLVRDWSDSFAAVGSSSLDKQPIMMQSRNWQSKTVTQSRSLPIDSMQRIRDSVSPNWLFDIY